MRPSRAGAAAVLTLAAACSSADAPVQAQADEGAQPIECAIGPGAGFGPDCLVERAEIDGTIVLTVRHADGGFRRFAQLPEGRGLVAYDGADPVEQTLAGEVLEVAIAGERYRFAARPSQGTDAGE
ncbi:hypothetical protein V5F89_08505 [Pelagerythrobacter marensis]|uniref:Lipoprotein n=1 Tax=Pelagerythrobacter marensis TaxID=543877 RepID=A0ABZ2D383_9SPHN